MDSLDALFSAVDAIVEKLCEKHEMSIAYDPYYEHEIQHLPGPVCHRVYEAVGLWELRDKWECDIQLFVYEPDDRDIPIIEVTTWRKHNEERFMDVIPEGMDRVEYTIGNIVKFERFLERVFARMAESRKDNYAARKIQSAFKRAIANPEYLLCRRRLMREAVEMNE